MTKGTGETETLALLRAVAGALEDKKGRDIVVWDVRGHSGLTDYVVAACGLNGPHLKALANATRVRLKALGQTHGRQTGAPDSGWIVADYLDVIVHLFLPETRAHYDFDVLFQDAPRVPWSGV